MIYSVEMDVAKERIKAAAALNKEERLVKGTEEGDSSAFKSVKKLQKEKLTEMTPACPRKPSSSQVTALRRGSRHLSQAVVRARGQ